MSTESIGQKLRALRKERNLSLRQVAIMLNMDVAILSKVERGERRLTKAMVQQLGVLYGQDTEALLVLFFRDKVLQELGENELALKALQVAEVSLLYKAQSTLNRSDMINDIKTVLENDGRVSAAWLFGSTARGEAAADSDVDILVELNHKRRYSLFDLADIAHQIESKIHRPVDLVEKGYLKDFAQRDAKKDWIKIYG